MQISILLFFQILKMFFMCLMGFLVVKSGHLKSRDSGALSAATLYIVCPCAIINAFQVENTPERARALFAMFIAAAVVEFAMLLIATLLAKPLKLSEVELGTVAYSNAGNLIIPIIQSILGQEWVFYTSAYMGIQTVLFWTHLKGILSGDRKPELKKVITSINILAVLFGLAGFLAKVRYPVLIADTISAVAGTIGPLSMIITGMLLADVDFGALFRRGRVWLIAALRLIVLPLLTIPVFVFACRVSGIADGHMIMMIAFLAAAAPSASSVVQMARLYDHDAEYAGALNVITVILCILTMPVMTAVYTYFLPV